MTGPAATPASPDHEMVAKFYTGARKFPRYFGRFLDGRKVWGGPYKITQLAVGGLFTLLTVTTYTLRWWSTGSWITDVVMGGAAIFGVLWASGKIPQTKRNPLAVVLSFLHALAVPRAGTCRGKAAPPPAHRRRPRTKALPPRPAATASAARPGAAAQGPAENEPDPPAPQPGTPATGVARLLAQAGARD